MTDQEIKKALLEKIRQNMDSYTHELLRLNPEELIGKAQEIAAVQFCCNELSAGKYPIEDIEYLLRFENPLEVVADQWTAEQGFNCSFDLDHVLWKLRDTGDAEVDYALDPSWVPDEEGGQILC